MVIFYDSQGNVVGSLSSPLPEIEEQATFKDPSINKIIVDEAMSARFNDLEDPLHPHACVVDNGQLREFTQDEYAAQLKQEQEQAKIVKDATGQVDGQPR